MAKTYRFRIRMISEIILTRLFSISNGDRMPREMTSFAAVIDAGGFTAAARATGRSKALISQHVKSLEQDLGVQLLFRSTRRVEATEAGRLFYGYCRQILETEAAARDAIESLRGAPEGTVRLSVPVSFGEIFLNDIVAAFQRVHPRITIQLELENRYRDLKSAALDLAVRAGLSEDQEQVAVALGEYAEMLCASPGYVRRAGAPVRPSDLDGHPCLLNYHAHGDGRWTFFSADGAESIAVSGPLRLNHFPLIRDALVRGDGIGRLPRYLAVPEVRAGRLVALLPEYRSPSVPIFIVYQLQDRLPLKTRLFLDFVRDWFRDRPDLLTAGVSR